MILALALAAEPADTKPMVNALCLGINPCIEVESIETTGGRVVHIAETDEVPSEWSSGFGQPCVQRHYWWVPTSGAMRKIQSVCNDGYGASGVGEDQISVENGRFMHGMYGGSSWRWASEITLALQPPRVLSEGSMSKLMAMFGTDTSWDWTTFSGTHHTSVQVCGADDDAKDYASLLLPHIEPPQGYDWRTHSLGACALRTDSATGFVTHGAKSTTTDTQLRATKVGDALIVELNDDRWIETSESWLNADHVEVWTSPEAIDPAQCVRKHPAKQWAVMLDGTVHPAYGEPSAIRAEVVTVGNARRMRLTGLPRYAGITLVYSDSDDGASQERILATSELVFGHGESLGSVRTIDPTNAVCEVKDGALVVRETRVFSEPMIP